MTEDPVRLCDRTPLDGFASPRVVGTPADRAEVAEALADLGVDAVEIGRPGLRPDDAELAERLRELRGPVLVASSSADRAELVRCGDVARRLASGRLNICVALRERSDSRQIERLVRVALGYTWDVQLTLLDATLAPRASVLEALAAAAGAGARTLTLVDRGWALPRDVDTHVGEVGAALEGRPARVAVRCSNRLGLALANALAALAAGARQVETCVNGFGPALGVTPLEELVAVAALPGHAWTLARPIATADLRRVSQLVAARTGLPVPPNKPIVGSNALVEGASGTRDTDARRVLGWAANEADNGLATRSPRATDHPAGGEPCSRPAFERRLAELGVVLAPPARDAAFARYAQLASFSDRVSDADLRAILSRVAHAD